MRVFRNVECGKKVLQVGLRGVLLEHIGCALLVGGINFTSRRHREECIHAASIRAPHRQGNDCPDRPKSNNDTCGNRTPNQPFLPASHASFPPAASWQLTHFATCVDCTSASTWLTDEETGTFYFSCCPGRPLWRGAKEPSGTRHPPALPCRFPLRPPILSRISRGLSSRKPGPKALDPICRIRDSDFLPGGTRCEPPSSPAAIRTVVQNGCRAVGPAGTLREPGSASAAARPLFRTGAALLCEALPAFAAEAAASAE